MKAILIKDDKKLVWSDVPDPVLGTDDVMIEVHAAALNRADIMQVDGDYPPPPGCPEWPGLEVSGIITEIGEGARAKSSWKTGDKVCALLGGGGYAEYVNVRYDMVMPIPKNISLTDAAGLPEVYAANYLNLVYEGHLSAGQTIYISAGASGLASVAIPMAKAIGAKVVSSVIEDRHIEIVKNLGADIVFNSRTTSVESVFIELEEKGEPVNCALYCLGGEDLGKALGHMAVCGNWILIAYLAGNITEIDLRPILKKRIRLTGSVLRARTVDEKAEILASLVKDIWPKIEDGSIKVSIYKTFPIENAQEGHALMRSGKHNGKIIFTVK